MKFLCRNVLKKLISSLKLIYDKSTWLSIRKPNVASFEKVFKILFQITNCDIYAFRFAGFIITATSTALLFMLLGICLWQLYMPGSKLRYYNCEKGRMNPHGSATFWFIPERLKYVVSYRFLKIRVSIYSNFQIIQKKWVLVKIFKKWVPLVHFDCKVFWMVNFFKSPCKELLILWWKCFVIASYGYQCI